MTVEQGIFMNLTNHPTAKWAQGQKEAALALGFREVREPDGGMPLVPPTASTSEVEDLADAILEGLEGLPIKGACVAGEYTLTLALLLRLQARGVRCYFATTERLTQEMPQEDGSIKKISRFQFIRWREAPTAPEVA